MRHFQGFSSHVKRRMGGVLREVGGCSHGTTPLLGGPASDSRIGNIVGLDGGGGVSHDSGCNPILDGVSMFA